MYNEIICNAHTVVIPMCRLHDVLCMSKYRLRECLQLEGDVHSVFRTCSRFNDIVVESITISRLLDPLSPPTPATPSVVTIAEERDPLGVVSLTCNVDPPGGLYNITWNIPDSATIDGSDGLSGDSITVTPDLAASGVYQCLASNEFGCATGEKTLVFEGTYVHTYTIQS